MSDLMQEYINRGMHELAKKEREGIEYILRNLIDNPITGDITIERLMERNIISFVYDKHLPPTKIEEQGNKMVFTIHSDFFDKRMRAILTGAAAIRLGGDGLTVYTTWLGDQRLISPMVLTAHMWKRYAERANMQKHGIDLIKQYFMKNPHGKDSDNQKVVGKSVRWNGEDHLSCCVNDGVLLGQIVDGIYIARTFITYDMCSGLQQKEFEARRGEILTDDEMYEQSKKHYL